MQRNEQLSNRITSLQQKIQNLEVENAELKATSPPMSHGGDTPSFAAVALTARGSGLRGNDPAACAMANCCF
jgi:hypothetical protein